MLGDNPIQTLANNDIYLFICYILFKYIMESGVDALDYEFCDKKLTEINQIEQEEPETHYEDIPSTLKTGTCVSIKGFIKRESRRIVVNFICSSKKNRKPDIAYHFNPRLALRYVVRNSRIGNNWDKEETTSMVKFPFARNKEFEIDFFCTDNEFYTAVNGKHFCGFVYRVPLENVAAISVEGYADIHGIEYKQLKTYPKPSPQNVPFTVPMGTKKNEAEDQQLETPITAHLPKGFEKNWQLEICGRVKILPYAFYINLQDGAQIWPHPIIPLHLNPRFHSSYGNQVFVRNIWCNGSWGEEERTPGFPFTPGAHFCLALRKLEDRYALWVNGKLAGEFQFVSDRNYVDTLVICGDVVIKSIFLKTKIDDGYFSKSDEVAIKL